MIIGTPEGEMPGTTNSSLSLDEQMMLVHNGSFSRFGEGVDVSVNLVGRIAGE